MAARPGKQRIDKILVERGLAPSRERAQALVLAGAVCVADQRIDKPGTEVALDADIRVAAADLPFVSRGGLKLAHALDHFGLRAAVMGAVCLDAGASTGGFTDCLLQAGAARVHAVDVGYGQLAWKLRSDPRVRVYERENIRHLDPARIGEPVDLAVVDVSFISLTLVLPAIAATLAPGGGRPIVALVKPQFEVGKGEVGKGGVVRDPLKRQAAVDKVIAFAAGAGLTVCGQVESPIEGPAGNHEFLLWIHT
jgi:23S rRNA (cytidine1920-2'-O)/16S rRNA (cytidine1409-2'-O)-methyltransferase